MVYCGYGLSSCATGIVGSPSDDERGIAAEERIGHTLQQSGAFRELIDGQLIDVRVGNPDPRNLRSDIRHLNGDIGRQLTLKRRVPLLRVA